MTGYGKAETNIPGGKITVEIKSLNGKNADISIKTTLLPKDKELNVRQFIAQKLYRGNIDFFMTFEPNAAEDAKEIDTETALAYYRQIHNINSLIDNEFPQHRRPAHPFHNPEIPRRDGQREKAGHRQ